MRISSLYYRDNVRIAFPIMLSLAGQAVVQMADNIMVGRLGAPELAAVSLAGAIIMNTMVVGMGIATGLTPLVGQAHAQDDHERVAGFFQNSLLLNSAVALLLTSFLFILMPYLSMMGQPEEVVALSKGYYVLTSLSLIPFILFMTFKQYMEGIGNTKVAMVITISCNVMNIILNYIFIYGKFGAPAPRRGRSGLANPRIEVHDAHRVLPLHPPFRGILHRVPVFPAGEHQRAQAPPTPASGLSHRRANGGRIPFPQPHHGHDGMAGDSSARRQPDRAIHD